jgi:hypothetical protein
MADDDISRMCFLLCKNIVGRMHPPLFGMRRLPLRATGVWTELYAFFSPVSSVSLSGRTSKPASARYLCEKTVLLRIFVRKTGFPAGSALFRGASTPGRQALSPAPGKFSEGNNLNCNYIDTSLSIALPLSPGLTHLTRHTGLRAQGMRAEHLPGSARRASHRKSSIKRTSRQKRMVQKDAFFVQSGARIAFCLRMA